MISIDISRVPKEKHAHPDFLKLKSQMEQALAHQKWINAFCIHEAGHMIYFAQLGITQFTFLGPRIECDERNENFDGFMASIQPQSCPELKNPEGLGEILSTVAKAYVAGGVFAEQLTAAPDQGDEQDQANFDEICDVIERQSSIPLDRNASWKQAQADVQKDLRSPAFRTKAWEKAREIETIFGF